MNLEKLAKKLNKLQKSIKAANNDATKKSYIDNYIERSKASGEMKSTTSEVDMSGLFGKPLDTERMVNRLTGHSRAALKTEQDKLAKKLSKLTIQLAKHGSEFQEPQQQQYSQSDDVTDVTPKPPKPQGQKARMRAQAAAAAAGMSANDIALMAAAQAAQAAAQAAQAGQTTI